MASIVTTQRHLSTAMALIKQTVLEARVSHRHFGRGYPIVLFSFWFSGRRQKMIPPERINDTDISKNPARELWVSACSHPTSQEPAKAPRAPQLFTNASTSPATLLGSISGMMAQNGP